MTTQLTETECYRTPSPLRVNPLHRFAGRAHEVLDEIGDPPTWALTPHERGESIAELVAVEARIRARVCALAAEADHADVAASAEAHLLDCAAEHDAKALRALGSHLLEVVAPDRADELVAEKLAAEEARPARSRT